MKVMISQPMAGKTDAQIIEVRRKAVAYLESLGHEVENTLFDCFSDNLLLENGFKQIPLFYLAHSLESMSRCDAVYFCNGWQHARGCKIEHEAAEKYGLVLMYENGDAYETHR